MAVIKNQKQIQFFDLYKGIIKNRRTRFTSLFKEAGNSFTSNKSTLSLRDMFDQWEYAGIGADGSMLKVLSNNGVDILNITPPQVGSQVPFEASELEAINSSEGMDAAMFANQVKDIEGKKVKRIANSFSNSLELMAQEIFINGKYGDFDFSATARKAITLDSAGDLGTQLVDLLEAFEVKTGYQGKLIAGSDVINALLNQARSTTNPSQQTNVTLVNKYSTEESGSGYEFLVGAYNVKIEKFPLARKKDGTTIDTSSFLNIYAPENLGIGYAGIKVQSASGYPDILEAEIYIDLGASTDKRNPDVFIFGKGFPLPVIADVDLFERFDVTIS